MAADWRKDRHRQATHAGRLHGLRIHGMLVFDAKTDDISWIGETHDLTAAVGQDLVESDGAGLDAVDVRGRVAFSEQEFLLLHATQRRLSQTLLEPDRRTCSNAGAKSREAFGGGCAVTGSTSVGSLRDC